MKLRNKWTGEIGELVHIVSVNLGAFKQYRTLKEVYQEWEDAPEEKHYFIDNAGNVKDEKGHSRYRKQRQEIGNDFETKEEAEKAVEKLKALKRLKNKGFRFSEFSYTELCDYARINIKATMINDRINDDLNLLFGGEE